MEEKLTFRVDKQVTSLLTITVWSNLVCIALLITVNLVNFFRGKFQMTAEATEGSASQFLSPEMLLLLSVICIVWLLLRILTARRVARRLERVFLAIDGDTVEGVSLPDPSTASREYPGGRPFTVKIGAIREITSRSVTVMKKQTTPALVIQTEDESFVVPGIAQLDHVQARLLQMMDAASNRR